MSRANSDPREAYVRVGLAVLLILPLVLLSWKPAFAGVAPRTEKSSSQDQYEDQLRAADVFLKRAQQLLDTERLQEAVDAAKEGLREYQVLPNTLPKAVYGRANALSLIGMVFARAGEHPRAIEFWRKALTLYDVLKEAGLNPALSLEHMAGSLQTIGQLEEAADALVSAADLYIQAGDSEKAIGDRETALALLNRVPRTAQSLTKLAVVAYQTARLHMNLGQHEKAEARFRDALALFEQLSVAETVLSGALQGLAASLAELGRLEEALTYFNRELDLYRGKEDKEHHLARTLRNIAIIHQRQGHLADAVENYRMSALIYQRYDGSGTHAAKAWFNAGDLLHSLERYLEAAEYFRKALALYQTQQSAERDQATCHQRIAAALSLAGKWREAFAHLPKELEILRTLDGTESDQALAWRNMGLALERLSRHNEAYEAYRQALSLYNKLPGTEAKQTEILFQAGNLLLEMKQDSLALKTFSAALPLYKELQGTPEYSSYEHTISLTRTGELLADADRGAEAIDFYHQALTVSQGWKENEALRAQIRWSLGVQLIEHRRIAEGVAHLTGGSADYRWSQGARLLAMEAEDRRRFLNRHAMHARYLYRLAIEKTEVDGAVGFQAALSAKSISSEISQMENTIWLGQLANTHPAEIARLKELRRLIARRVLLQVSQYIEEFDVEGKELKPLAKEQEQLEAFIREKVAGLAISSQLPTPSMASLRPALRRGDVVLEYVTYAPGRPSGSEGENRDHYGVFVVRAEDERVIPIDLGPVAEIDQAILTYRQLYESQVDPIRFHLDEDVFAAQGLRLRCLLLDPILNRMPKPERMYVVPTGLISLIPFEALPQGRQDSGWRYLIQDYEVVYLTTARDLARYRRPRSSQSNEVWIVGDPDFDATPDERLGFKTDSSHQGVRQQYQDSIPNSWYRLDGVQGLLKAVERRIRNLHYQAKVLTDVDASEETLLELRSPRFLLIATHGYFMREIAPVTAITWSSTGGKGDFGPDFKVSMDPMMRSMLILAGANRRYHRVSASHSREKSASTEEVLQEVPARDRGIETRFELGDGLLTAYEVRNLDLQGTDLVVLVGCESGVGVVQRRKWKADRVSMSSGIGMEFEGGSLGSIAMAMPKPGDEAVTGLRQAFFIAGTRSIISSLWTVPLRPSTQLMDEFIEAWLNRNRGRSRYVAFRSAQLNALQRAGKNGSSHPFWWAGFVYVGDPNDLQNSR